MEFITLPEAKVPITMEADVVVIGGGPAGVGAAIQAARNGVSTILIERFSSLGGTNTSGYMCVTIGGEYIGELTQELFDRLRLGGYIVNLVEEYPNMWSSGILHFRSDLEATINEVLAFDPDMTPCVINDMMEESGVRLMLRTLFVDTIVEDGLIKAAIVENASGKQAVVGKVFVDSTGRGDVVARAGAPYVIAKDKMGYPTPPGLMWRMSGIDFEKLFGYEKIDPKLSKLVEKAKAKGDLPYYRPLKTFEQTEAYDLRYTGHPHPEMMPLIYAGDALMWAPIIHEWGVDAAENGEDLTRAEIQVRKEIVAEINFLKKYVPGFETAHLASIAPMMGIREGRHPIGEYVLTLDDIKNGRKFDDAAITMRTFCIYDKDNRELGRVNYDIPYGSFLPKKIDNLLLAGDNLSADHHGWLHIRTMPNAMRLGEVAGTAAALSVKSANAPKTLKWPTPKTIVRPTA